jgi:hypothetical protein
MGRGLGSKRKKDEDENEYEVDDVVPDRSRSSRNSRLELVGRLPPLRRHSRLGGDGGEDWFLHGFIIHPDNKYVSLAHSVTPTLQAVCSS